MKLTFDKISVKGRRVWKENGKRRTETVEFYQTENPFNKKADGTMKTRATIWLEIEKQLEAWIAAARKGERRWRLL